MLCKHKKTESEEYLWKTNKSTHFSGKEKLTEQVYGQISSANKNKRALFILIQIWRGPDVTLEEGFDSILRRIIFTIIIATETAIILE